MTCDKIAQQCVELRSLSQMWWQEPNMWHSWCSIQTTRSVLDNSLLVVSQGISSYGMNSMQAKVARLVLY